MEDTIKKAKEIVKIVDINIIEDDLKELEGAIERTWKYMRKIGVTDICKRCAEETGSCCREWVEDEVDEIILAMNMLMGVEIPERRFKDDRCYFLSEKGCVLKVRPTLCVNYLCEEIKKRIGHEGEKRLQEIAGRELELGFTIRDRILNMISSYSLERSSSESYRSPSRNLSRSSST